MNVKALSLLYVPLCMLLSASRGWQCLWGEAGVPGLPPEAHHCSHTVAHDAGERGHQAHHCACGSPSPRGRQLRGCPASPDHGGSRQWSRRRFAGCQHIHWWRAHPSAGTIMLSLNHGFFFFFTFVEKKPEPGKLTIFFIFEKNGGMMRHYCRLASHRDLIRISRFFSTNLEVSRIPDSTRENPSFLFCFEIGKTKRRLTLSHVPCLQAHKVWAKNKFYDRRPWLSPLHTATQRVK